MNFTEIERAIVDLNIISQLRKNSKISVYDPTYLAVQDHIPLITPLMRWLYDDDNSKSIIRIKTLINNCERYLEDVKLDNNLRRQLIEALQKSITGLTNLEYTYSIAYKTSGQVDLIIKQIQAILEKQNPSPKQAVPEPPTPKEERKKLETSKEGPKNLETPKEGSQATTTAETYKEEIVTRRTPPLSKPIPTKLVSPKITLSHSPSASQEELDLSYDERFSRASPSQSRRQEFSAYDELE